MHPRALHHFLSVALRREAHCQIPSSALLKGFPDGRSEKARALHLDEVYDLGQLVLSNHRPQAAVLIQWVAGLNGLCTLLQAGVELIGDALVHQ